MDDVYKIELEQYSQDLKEWEEKYKGEVESKPIKSYRPVIPKKENADEHNSKFEAFKNESRECFLNLRMQIKNQLKNQRKKLEGLPEGLAKRYRQ